MISPSGVDYEAMGAEDVGVHASTVHRWMRHCSRPASWRCTSRSTQLRSHRVVHTHAPASTALSTLVDEVPATHYYSALFGGDSRRAYATFGSDALAHNVIDALADRTAALRATTVPSWSGAMSKLLTRVPYLEYVCDVQLRAMATGRPPRVLDDDEIAEVARRLAGYGQSAAAATTEQVGR